MNAEEDLDDQISVVEDEDDSSLTQKIDRLDNNRESVKINQYLRRSEKRLSRKSIRGINNTETVASFDEC